MVLSPQVLLKWHIPEVGIYKRKSKILKLAFSLVEVIGFLVFFFLVESVCIFFLFFQIEGVFYFYFLGRKRIFFLFSRSKACFNSIFLVESVYSFFFPGQRRVLFISSWSKAYFLSFFLNLTFFLGAFSYIPNLYIWFVGRGVLQNNTLIVLNYSCNNNKKKKMER